MINEEQRKARASGIFSSDTPRIAAGKQVEVYLEKVGEREHEDLSEIDMVELGNLLEPVVLGTYLDQLTPEALESAELSPDTLRHPLHEWLGAHLDALLPNTVIEAKVVGNHNRRLWGDPGSDEIPDNFLWQVQHQMAVTGRSVAHLPVAFATYPNLTGLIVRKVIDIEVYVVERSETMIRHLIAEGGRVWDAVTSGVPPIPQTVEDARLLYAVDRPGAIEATPAIAAAVEQRASLSVEIKRLEREVDEVTTVIMDYMREATDLRFAGRTLCTWRTPKPSRVLDQKTLKEQMPGIAEQFTIERPGARRFLVK